ncbi:hypothetical protein PVAND_009521 [Polypedilum vanderplanki]|uniref:Arrestin C-terminal-like domain-containing protein n=1 Tax=Polypedilum vanderplanki TaxID=319348 RepID=A0A9J6CDZ7_POLVA|nr:hypothetical protein PVAND_009521 [Polypedilum vanderplanki]
MVTCNIKYDNNQQGVYYSGQTLSGVIEINNEKKRDIKGVTLKIEGYAKCKWTESEGTGKRRRTVYYNGRDDYINTFSYLIGSFNSKQIEFSSGVHKFNFHCALPPQLPTSFESKYGYVRYQIKVEIERPWKTDIKNCFAFTVIKNFDLNYGNPQLKLPLKTETSKSFYMGLFSSQLLHMSAEIPFCGYVSGQFATISVFINNESNVEVLEIIAELKKLIQYNSDTPRMRTKQRIESCAVSKDKGVPTKSKLSTEIILVIPAVPPTNTGTCRVINVFYEIHVTARVKGFHRNPYVVIPITIGTVPLISMTTGMYPQLPQNDTSELTAGWSMPMPQQQPSSSATAPLSLPLQIPLQPTRIAPSAPQPTTPEDYGDMPPPSYHEAMNMPTTSEIDNDEGLNDQQPFNPRYPVFNFGIQPPNQPPSYSSNDDEKKMPY